MAKIRHHKLEVIPSFRTLRRVMIGIISSVWSFLAIASLAVAQQDQPITPQMMGFQPRVTDGDEETIRYYVSTGGRPLDEGAEPRPLVLYLEGSGPSPLVWRENGRVGSAILFDARDFPDWHFAVISRPGIEFFESSQRVVSEEYREKMCLRWRVEAAKAVLRDLVNDGLVDSRKVLVLGHSEGSDVAPWVALESPFVTHVAALAPGGLSLMFDFIALTRKEIEAGELDREEGEQQIHDMKDSFREIFSDPESTTKLWAQEPYLRWSSFFRPGLDAWRQLNKPIYLGVCRDDRNTAPESGEVIELELIRLQKKRFRSTIWPCDHYFLEDTEQGLVEWRLDVLKDLLEWIDKTPASVPSLGAPGAADAFVDLKRLVGQWEGVDELSVPSRLQYSLEAGGHVLVERRQTFESSDSLTVYHLEDSRLIATDYGSGGGRRIWELVAPTEGGRLLFQSSNELPRSVGGARSSSFQIGLDDQGTLWRGTSDDNAGAPHETRPLPFRRITGASDD